MEYKTFEDGKTYNYNYIPNTHAVEEITISGDPDGYTSIDFTYDDYGNTIKKELYNNYALTEEYSFTYDENSILSAFTDGVTEVSFKYDNNGQRIVKLFEDSVGVISENIYVNDFYTISDSDINKHISDGNCVFATLVENSTDNILYYTSNNIGSTVMLTDNGGNKIQSYLYTPFGEMWVEETYASPELTEEITRLFTGQEWDQETGLYYMNARYYDPDIGIFTKPDPAMDGLNHYAYVSGNPINYIDPTGLFDWKDWSVTSGDTLWDIVAQANEMAGTNYTVNEIAELNDISKPEEIYPGDKVFFPNDVYDAVREEYTIAPPPISSSGNFNG